MEDVDLEIHPSLNVGSRNLSSFSQSKGNPTETTLLPKKKNKHVAVIKYVSKDYREGIMREYEKQTFLQVTRFKKIFSEGIFHESN